MRKPNDDSFEMQAYRTHMRMQYIIIVLMLLSITFSIIGIVLKNTDKRKESRKGTEQNEYRRHDTLSDIDNTFKGEFGQEKGIAIGHQLVMDDDEPFALEFVKAIVQDCPAWLTVEMGGYRHPVSLMPVDFEKYLVARPGILPEDSYTIFHSTKITRYATALE